MEEKKEYLTMKEKSHMSIIQEKMNEVFHEQVDLIEEPRRLGGMNNTNFLVRTTKGDFVFRLPGKGSNESVNRESEWANSKIAYEIGLNCQTVYFDAGSGIKITEYINDSETLTIEIAKDSHNMSLMAQALRQLHYSGTQFLNTFDPLEEMTSYIQTIENNDKDLLAQFPGFSQMHAFLLHEHANHEIHAVPSHLDAWPENFIKDSQKIYLVDWEYSANYDPTWDVVSISLECDYDAQQEEAFNTLYFGRKLDAMEKEKMDYMRILMDVYWSLWALSKVSCGETDLLAYAVDRYTRAKKNAATKLKLEERE